MAELCLEIKRRRRVTTILLEYISTKYRRTHYKYIDYVVFVLFNQLLIPLHPCPCVL